MAEGNEEVKRSAGLLIVYTYLVFMLGHEIILLPWSKEVYWPGMYDNMTLLSLILAMDIAVTLII